MNIRRTVAILLVGIFASACAEGPALRGRIAGLQKTVDDADKNGAMKCAPRELAVARSNLEFAQIDLDQPKAYSYAIEVMAATSQLPDAREGMHAFLEKRKPQWRRGRN